MHFKRGVAPIEAGYRGAVELGARRAHGDLGRSETGTGGGAAALRRGAGTDRHGERRGGSSSSTHMSRFSSGVRV
jgi:hypothetical protein